MKWRTPDNEYLPNGKLAIKSFIPSSIGGPDQSHAVATQLFGYYQEIYFFLLDCTSNSIRVNMFSQAQHTEIPMYILLES